MPFITTADLAEYQVRLLSQLSVSSFLVKKVKWPIMSKLQQTTKYAGVFKDLKSGRYFFQTELGVDRISGKRIRRKGRKDGSGRPFLTAAAANKELTRLRKEYYEVNSYANFRMSYEEFMDQVYIPAYKTDVEESTFLTRQNMLRRIRDRFGKKTLREINVEDVQNFRTYLLTPVKDGGAGFSQSYASLYFGTFRKTLDLAVELQYLEFNISKRVKAIAKGKTIVPYWTKDEFEKVISQIYIDDYFEHLDFVMLWTYFMTGIRVNEGMALWWDDINLEKGSMRIHHMLILKSRSDWHRNGYTKTEDGKRTIALDDDTVSILRNWKHRQKSMGLGSENDFVFSYDGLPMIKSTLANVIGRYSKVAGVKRIQGKGLRHSHASYLINEFNVSVLVLSRRLGHSSPEITLKHYAHMWVGADETIAEEMAGNIKLKTASKTQVKMQGNMPNIDFDTNGCPPNIPPKVTM